MPLTYDAINAIENYGSIVSTRLSLKVAGKIPKMFLRKFLAFSVILLVTFVVTMGKPADTDSQSPCPQMCTMEYAPVCATLTDGSTLEFANKCASTVAKCTRNLGRWQ